MCFPPVGSHTHHSPSRVPPMPRARTPAAEQARLLAAVAEPTRLDILGLLRGGPRAVGTIAAAVGVPLVNISHHLRVLREVGILVDQRQGRHVEYRLHPEAYRPAGGAGGADVLELAGLRLHLGGC